MEALEELQTKINEIDQQHEQIENEIKSIDEKIKSKRQEQDFFQSKKKQLEENITIFNEKIKEKTPICARLEEQKESVRMNVESHLEKILQLKQLGFAKVLQYEKKSKLLMTQLNYIENQVKGFESKKWREGMQCSLSDILITRSIIESKKQEQTNNARQRILSLQQAISQEENLITKVSREIEEKKLIIQQSEVERKRIEDFFTAGEVESHSEVYDIEPPVHSPLAGNRQRITQEASAITNHQSLHSTRLSDTHSTSYPTQNTHQPIPQSGSSPWFKELRKRKYLPNTVASNLRETRGRFVNGLERLRQEDEEET